MGRTLSSAQLRLYCYDQDSFGYDDHIDFHLVSEVWGEDTVTWNNQPTVGTDAFASVLQSDTAAAAWIEIDVMTQVQQWLDGQANYGFLFKYRDEVNGYMDLLCRSKEYTDDQTKRPQLLLTFA